MKARDYQQEAIDALVNYFRQSLEGNPVLVLPTGAGKSVIIALFVRWVLDNWPNQRILILTHVKELIEQNHEKLITVWPDAPAGIYSASLNRRDDKPVLFAGVQSIYKRGFDFEPFDLVLVDECHLIPKQGHGQYVTLLEALKLANPYVRVIGLSATPYRMDSGLLTEGEGRIFTDIAYELPISRLLKAGYLSPLVSKNAAAKIDLTDVKTRAGDYSKADLERAAMADGLTVKAVDEIVTYGAERESWLVFCSGVNHAHEVSGEINRRGIACEVVTGSTPKAERAEIIAAHKAGELRALANCDVLTTGYDAPCIDLVALLRATKSPNLYVQMCGRGMRLSPGKSDCLVLDFGLNVERHGPIDSIVVKKNANKGEKSAQGAPTKECPECRSLISVFENPCSVCAYQFPAKPKHEETASEAAILSIHQRRPEWRHVHSVSYSAHAKPGKPTSLKVSYLCGLDVFNEWVCLEHFGYAARKAEIWWLRRTGEQAPLTVSEALEIIKARGILEPSEIQVKKEGKYSSIVSYKFGANTNESTQKTKAL